ncbi:cryptochrome [Trichocladium antarcticum]|uniref:Cryptochrome DASH n=1 Tax=Trichocladium antarcticum TaxID=1450529 RepID=A0AAN6ZF80_9PEZI|nr:cryptochrome [Trichocladium antarcticum]
MSQTEVMTAPSRVLVHVVRRDLRVSDQPILHHLASSPDHGFTHLVPLYVFPAQQMDLSGLVKDGGDNPYPGPRSKVGNYPRCGPHRAKFVAEAVWDLKRSLESLDSGLAIRAGMIGDVVRHLAQDLTASGHKVAAVWMTSHEGTEEKNDERAVASVCRDLDAEYKLWEDEKYLIDDRDIGLDSLGGLLDVFTTYRKSQEPLREKPRAVLPTPAKGSLPPLPDLSTNLGPTPPLCIPGSAQELIDALVKPVKDFLPDLPDFPGEAESAHPFNGGETAAHARMNHLLRSGCLVSYQETRNGLLGSEFSTKLSAYLAQGCITSRQIHHGLLSLENGTDSTLENADGYGAGENKGTQCVRFELLWRDYMRLCHQRFKDKVFRLEGTRDGSGSDATEEEVQQTTPVWKTPARERAHPDQDPTPARIAEMLGRFCAGTTGIGLIDASQRELMHTGYTSNRARQNVANFLAKHLGIDWRHGAEWYEMLLVDYDVSSSWANWQYVSGVGNDPRGSERMFNPVKQAFEYDSDGQYVRAWVPELSPLQQLENLFQAWTTPEADIRAAGLEGNVMITDPILRIPFWVSWKPKRRKDRRGGRRGGRGGVGGSAEAVPERRETPSGSVDVDSSAGSDESESRAPSNYAPSAYAPSGNGPLRAASPASGRPTYPRPGYPAPAYAYSNNPIYTPTTTYPLATYVPHPYTLTYTPVYRAAVLPHSAYAPPVFGHGGGRGFQGQGQRGHLRGGMGSWNHRGSRGGGGSHRGGSRGGHYRGSGGGYRGGFGGVSAPVAPSQSAA